MKAMHFQDVPGSYFRTSCCIHIEFRVILASVLVFVVALVLLLVRLVALAFTFLLL